MSYQKKPQPQAASLNTIHAAAYLGISKTSLEHARLSGEINGLEPPPYVRIGRLIRYRVVDLDAWLNALPSHQHTASEATAS